MQYRFFLTYTPTDGTAGDPRECHPNYSDDLDIAIDREDGEWYYKRKLDGSITFLTADYSWIMGQAFDGTFTLTIKESHDLGAHWYDYFEGTFSRANLEIDEDNQAAIIASFIEGVYNAIENGKDEEFDLMKLIPDSELKTVESNIYPALALVDECSDNTDASFSDMYSGAPFLSGGYKAGNGNFWALDKNMASNAYEHLQGIIAEAEVTYRSGLKQQYSGIVQYSTKHIHYTSPVSPNPEYDYYKTTIVGIITGRAANNIRFDIHEQFRPGVAYNPYMAYLRVTLPNGEYNDIEIGEMYQTNTFYSPINIIIDGDANSSIKSTSIIIHYIYSSLLFTKKIGRRASLWPANILDTGNNYKYMRPFEGSSLTITTSHVTSDDPNGYRMVPGTNEPGALLQYFAPPDNTGWIPLAQDNWNYESFWYKVTPTITNGLLAPAYVGSVSWVKCWTITTCIRYLLDKITNHKVIFDESSAGSQFLFDPLNPITGKYNYTYLVTPKSNVMYSGNQNATRCPVRLNWFLELLHNAFNCYYWLEKRDDDKYLFRVEHVEYFRRGGHYDGTLPAGIDLTTMTPGRNFPRDNSLVKHLSDQTNKYKYDLKNMAEKYTFSWQGDGGSDDFKGNPMFFKAGWIETGSSEDHQVDNIFADLAWLMLNAGTNTASSKNYDGVFLFAGSQNLACTDQWTPNYPASSMYFWITQSQDPLTSDITFVLTIPAGQTVSLYSWGDPISTYTGTGSTQEITIGASDLPYLYLDFGYNYADVIINYVFYANPNNAVFQVASTPNLLRNDGSTLQNGPLAWPWLQNDFLHYDIPARKWSLNSDDLDSAEWQNNGTVKMVQKQEISIFPMPEKATEDTIMAITGIRTAIEGGKTGIITNAKINLSSRNAELTVIYNPDS